MGIELLDLKSLIGMSKRSAVRKVENARMIARVVAEGGAMPLDYNDERVTLVVDAAGEVIDTKVG